MIARLSKWISTNSLVSTCLAYWSFSFDDFNSTFYVSQFNALIILYLVPFSYPPPYLISQDCVSHQLVSALLDERMLHGDRPSGEHKFALSFRGISC